MMRPAWQAIRTRASDTESVTIKRALHGGRPTISPNTGCRMWKPQAFPLPHIPADVTHPYQNRSASHEEDILGPCLLPSRGAFAVCKESDPSVCSPPHKRLTWNQMVSYSQRKVGCVHEQTITRHSTIRHHPSADRKSLEAGLHSGESPPGSCPMISSRKWA